MGRQIRFYMTSEDEDEFVEFIHSTGKVVILAQTTDKKGGEEFAHFCELAGRRLGDDACIWNRSISPEPTMNYSPAHGGCYCMDFMESEVVNVIRPEVLSNDKLSMGRLHIDNHLTLPDGTVGNKSVEFVEWYETLRKWIKKTHPRTANGAYLSARAELMSKSGVRLVGHRF